MDKNREQPEWTGQEELRDLVYRGGKVPGYKISKNGLVISYKVKKIDGKVMKWYRRSKTNDYPAVSLQIPEELVGHAINKEAIKYKRSAKGFIEKSINVHILVADAWLETENNCPENLKPWWNDICKEFQNELRQFFFVDHINDNTWNPHVDNLKFLSTRHNNYHIKIAMNKEVIKNSS